MRNQQGSTLVVALIFLTIITIVSIYSLEGSNLQSKMVANSLFSSLTYQECRNEQQANIRYYNTDSNRNDIIDVIKNGSSVATSTLRSSDQRKSDAMEIAWRYIGDLGISTQSGMSIGSGAQTTTYVFEHDCNAEFSFSTNSQTLGVKVDALKLDGKVI